MKITFNQAITKHKEGRIKEAEQLYRYILRIQPEHVGASNNLGTLLHGLGRLDEAEASFRKAFSQHSFDNLEKSLSKFPSP